MVGTAEAKHEDSIVNGVGCRLPVMLERDVKFSCSSIRRQSDLLNVKSGLKTGSTRGLIGVFPATYQGGLGEEVLGPRCLTFSEPFGTPVAVKSCCQSAASPEPRDPDLRDIQSILSSE